MYQIFWSENILPHFDEEIKKEYSKFCIKQVLPVGVDHDGRQLIHAVIKIGCIPHVMDYLNSLGKETHILNVCGEDGVRYGWEKVQTGVDAEGTPIYEIQPILDEEGQQIPIFPLEELEYKTFFPIVTDDNGVSYRHPFNTFLGWETWRVDF